MNIIFLDMDGVLCTMRAVVATKDGGLIGAIDQVAVGMLNTLQDMIFEQHGETTRIVVSSTWRKDGWLGFGYNMPRLLQCIGLRVPCASHKDHEEIFRTPDLQTKRGLEIQEWITDYGDVLGMKRYAILDDDSDMLESQMQNFVKTDCYDGMSFNNYLKLRDIFEVKTENYHRSSYPK